MRRDTNSLPNESPGGGGAAPAPLAAALDAASARRLRRVALRITRDPSAADDVVQGAFEKALRHGAAFRGEARPSTWLHRIVVNEALMWHRSEARRRAQRARAAAAADFDAEPVGPDALSALIARERGLHPSAAKTRAFRARRALRAALEPAASRRDPARPRRVARARAQQQPPPSHGPRVSR